MTVGEGIFLIVGILIVLAATTKTTKVIDNASKKEKKEDYSLEQYKVNLLFKDIFTTDILAETEQDAIEQALAEFWICTDEELAEKIESPKIKEIEVTKITK